MEKDSILLQKQQSILNDFCLHPDKYLSEKKAKIRKRKDAIVKSYIEYSILITHKKVTAARVMEIIAGRYKLTRQNIMTVLKEYGVYVDRSNPVVFPDNLTFAEDVSDESLKPISLFLY